MKIVHCFFTMKTGGAQLLAIDILNELVSSHEVSLIIINNQWDTALVERLNKKVAVYFINRKEGSRNPFAIVRFNRLLHDLKPDLIHCHERKLIKLIFYKKAKTLYTIHDVGIPTDTFKSYNALAAISHSVANDINKRSSFEPTVIYNGIRMSDFRQRRTYAIHTDKPIRIIQVSRLMHDKKGQDILLHALAKLMADGLTPPISLDFIGAGQSLEHLSDLVKSLNIGNLVNFLGERDRTWIAENLACYHMLVQPSRYEGFGLTLLEGLAAGLPVVASNIEGPSEILTDLPTGTLFASGNIEACAQAISDVINTYLSTSIESSINQTRSLIEEKFTIKSMMRGYLCLYKQILQPTSVTEIGIV